MDNNSKLKRSLKQHHNSRMEMDKNRTFQGDRSLNFQDKSKVNDLVSSSNRDLKYERIHNAQNKESAQPESMSNYQRKCQEGNTIKDDELVKYMSSLPDYLSRLDSVNFQGNALNVGVLDWSRLENWKDKKKNSFDTAGKASSSTSSKSTVNSSSSRVCSKASGHLNELHSSAPNASSSIDMGGSKSFKHIQDFETALVRKGDRLKKITWASKSLDRDFSDGMVEKNKQKVRDQKQNSEEKGTSLSSRRNLGVSHDQSNFLQSQNNNVERKSQELQEIGSSRQRREASSQNSRPSSSTIVREGSSSSGNKTNAVLGETKWRGEELQDLKASSDHQHGEVEPNNIVLLYPKNVRRSRFSEVSRHPNPETTTAKDLRGGENLKGQSKNHDISGSVPMKSHSEKIHNDVPKVARLHSRVKGDTKHNVQSSRETQKNDTSSDVSHKLPHSSEIPEMLPKHALVEEHSQNMRTKNLSSVEDKSKENYELHMKTASSELSGTLKILDQETAELAARRSRNLSSNRRFSFSLPRLGRNFSFKEDSEVHQLSSSYVSGESGTVRSELSAHLHTTKVEKDRAKSSPFRRLLDPLLRTKGADPSQTRDSGQGNFGLNFVSGRSHKKEKVKITEVQATLKLTIKNGLPLYKFVVGDDSNIFAATMKNFSIPGKDDSRQNYTFYSINEIKKRSGSWLAQGSKGKSTRYAYNVVGQMKVLSYSTSVLAEQKTSSNYMVIESVLLDADKRQADKELPKLFPDNELAAVVVRIPSETLSHGGQMSVEDKDSVKKSDAECVYGNKCTCDLRRTRFSMNTTVILPGGIHSLPIEGGPSPLISRWKSGSCDCGGWDVGCRLDVLSNEKKSYVEQETSRSCLVLNHFELFDQVRIRNERPAFSLAPLGNGIYSVRFNTSISLLQAFFISVAVINNQQLSSVFDFSILAEAILQEPELSGIDQETTPTLDPMQGHGKYVSPPFSPIGRV